MKKSNLLDIETILTKLDSYSDLSDEVNRDTFRLLVEEFGSWGHPLTIQYLLRYLDDDSDYPEVLFDIVHAVESYKSLVYIQRLLPLIPSLLNQAPQWTRVLHYRIFNHSESLNIYKERLKYISNECRYTIKSLLLMIKSEDPEFSAQCDLLLYSINKEEMKELVSPVDIEALTNKLQSAFQNAVGKIILKHTGDKPCGLGITFNQEDLRFCVSIDTGNNVLPEQANRWDVNQWLDHEIFTVPDTCLTLQSQNAQSHIASDQLEFYISECSVRALENLYNQGFFPRECIIIFTLAQDHETAQILEWVERLNTQDNAVDFREWLTIKFA